MLGRQQMLNRSKGSSTLGCLGKADLVSKAEEFADGICELTPPFPLKPNAQQVKPKVEMPRVDEKCYSGIKNVNAFVLKCLLEGKGVELRLKLLVFFKKNILMVSESWASSVLISRSGTDSLNFSMLWLVSTLMVLNLLLILSGRVKTMVKSKGKR